MYYKNNFKNNLNFKLPKFGTGGTSRYKYIIIFVIFILSISIRSFGTIEPDAPGNPVTIGEGEEAKQYYELSTPGHLYWFADQVNNQGKTNINAKLTEDIEVINLTDRDAYGGLQALLDGTKTIDNLSSDEKTALDALNWTPIGKDDTKPYTGTFDGAGHTISGIYCNSTAQAFAGLFGYIGENGVVKNLGIIDSYIYRKTNGMGSSYLGSLVGACEGKVINCYSSGVSVGCEGGQFNVLGGLVAVCSGTIKNCYCTNTEIGFKENKDLRKGVICGLVESTNTSIENCYYLKNDGINSLTGVGGIGWIGNSNGDGASFNEEEKVEPRSVTEFTDGTVEDELNSERCEGYEFEQNKSRDENSREYLKLKKSITPVDSEITLKIPVRVKINYDPSNNLESLVSKNFKHEFFRKKTYDDSWEEMLQNIHYFYTVSPVENSIKINPDGSKTQDFIFSYYIYHAKDSSGKDYKFGFNKKYPVNTYLKQDVGGGKKLFIDYGVWGRE